MRPERLAAPLFVVAVGLASTACGEAPSDEHVIDEPVTIEHHEGDAELPQLTLTQQAVQRLDLQSEVVTEVDGTLAIPQGAVMVDPEGGFWVYVRTGPTSYQRQEISIAREEDDLVFLDRGPAAGSEVITLGAAELWGAEHGIGH